jgi:hypothetical protein
MRRKIRESVLDLPVQDVSTSAVHVTHMIFSTSPSSGCRQPRFRVAPQPQQQHPRPPSWSGWLLCPFVAFALEPHAGAFYQAASSCHGTFVDRRDWHVNQKLVGRRRKESFECVPETLMHKIKAWEIRLVLVLVNYAVKQKVSRCISVLTDGEIIPKEPMLFENKEEFYCIFRDKREREYRRSMFSMHDLCS